MPKVEINIPSNMLEQVSIAIGGDAKNEQQRVEAVRKFLVDYVRSLYVAGDRMMRESQTAALARDIQ